MCCANRVFLLLSIIGLCSPFLAGAAQRTDDDIFVADLKAAMTDLAAIVAKKDPLIEDCEKVSNKIQALNYFYSQQLMLGQVSKHSISTKAASGAIAEYNEFLVQCSLDEKRSQLRSVSRQCLSLLDYTLATPSLVRDLRSRMLRGGQIDWRCVDLMFELRSLSKADYDLLAMSGSSTSDSQKRVDWAVGLARLYGADGISVFEQVMAIPFDPSEIDGDGGSAVSAAYEKYAPVLLAAEYLGVKLARLLPLFEARLAEIQFRLKPPASRIYELGFINAIMLLKGERLVKTRYAVNGSGPLAIVSAADRIVSEQLEQPRLLKEFEKASNVSHVGLSIYVIVSAFALLLVVAFVVIKVIRRGRNKRDVES